MQKTNFITIKILDKEFSLSCPPEQEIALRTAAHYLDGQMRQIRHKGRVVGVDRIAITAALNITHEMMSLRQQSTQRDVSAYTDKINLLVEKLSEATQSLPNKRIEDCVSED